MPPAHPSPTTRIRMTAGPRGPVVAARLLAARKARALRSRSDSRAPRARQGLGRVRHAEGHARHLALHEGQGIRASRQGNAALHALLDGGRRARRGRRRARRARLLDQVLHRRGQLGRGRQQHAGVLHSRSAEVSGLHPHAKARSVHEHAQQCRRVGLLVASSGVAASGDDSDERPRHSAELPADARLRFAHVLVHQREQRALLGEVPLQVACRHRELHRCRSGAGGRARSRKRAARSGRQHRRGQLPDVAFRAFR